MNHSETIYDKLKSSRSLPSPPQVLLKLLDACNSHTVSPRELADIVFHDPSISTKILQMINSSFMGLRDKINDLEKAVIYLGIDTIKNVAVSASVFQVFHRVEGNHRFNLNHFWWHSVMCGTIAKRIAKKIGYSSIDEAFLSGMLHDIGKLVFWSNFREQYSAALQASDNNSALLIARESEIGATHYELGAWLVRQWRLNSLMADAILYHHDRPERVADAFPLVKIIFLANLLSGREEKGDASIPEVARTLFGFDAGQTADILAGAAEEVADVAKSLGIPTSPPDVSPVEPNQTDDVHDKNLSTAVKHLSLMYGTLQNLLKAGTREAILKTAAHGFQILFGIQRFFFFIFDAESNLLRGYALSPNTGTEEDLVLSCKNRKSLLSACFFGKTPFDSFQESGNHSLSIADEQIHRLLGTDGMAYFPITADGEAVGIIATGINAAQSKLIAEQTKLLDLFIGHTGMCLYVQGIKQSQAGLIESERLEASATVARKVVHEVNNPLGIIKNYLQILSLKLPEKHPAQTELLVISEEIDRVGLIVRSLKDYASPEIRMREVIDINRLLKTILAILEPSILKPALIQLHFSSDPAVPEISTDKNGLKQVIINLIKNAVEAMAGGGNIHIDTRFTATPDAEPSAAGKKAGTIRIRIQDDGPGIPEAIKRHLFEPFHSSKKEGHSGLGLSIVRNIIKELGGAITCESSPQAGTVFIITLPTALEEISNYPGG